MFRSARRLLLPLLLAALLPACATVTTGTTTNISVLTEPAGAACTLTRQGEVVGVVNPTPGTVRVSNSSHQPTSAASVPDSTRGSARSRPSSRR